MKTLPVTVLSRFLSAGKTTLREDLLLEVRRLAEEQRFDYLLIESSGISEPMPVAATFSFEDEEEDHSVSHEHSHGADPRHGAALTN